MHQESTLVDVIKNAAQQATGITFIRSSHEEEYVSYSALLSKAQFTLFNLQQKGVKEGDEVIIQVSDNLDFLQVFWACILGKMIPVPVAIGRQEGHKYKLYNIWKKLTHPFLVCDEAVLQKMMSYQVTDEVEEAYHNIAANTLYTDQAIMEIARGKESEIVAQDIAYIQFSSGSTGDPKGVVLTHENLYVNITDIANRSEITAEDKALSWLPLTHDMGLICFHLSTTLRTIQQYLLPTTLFIRRPLLWMNKASEHKATLLYSPNFGYQYIMSAIATAKEELTWNLNAVRTIYNGAEPISARLCYEFLERMKDFGLQERTLYPGYGLAEACVAVTLPKVGAHLTFYYVDRNYLKIGDKIKHVESKDTTVATSFAEVGYPIDQCEVRICNDEDTILEEQHIGHIQIKGGNVTEAYYNQEAVTRECKTTDGWHRTGDLGFMINGALVITGRAKNIIIINGQNIYPQDIEEYILETLGLKPGTVVACGARKNNDESEGVFVFVQQRKLTAAFIQTAIDIKREVLEGINIEVAEVIAVKSIPKTTSGKVQHYQLVQRYIQGEFEEQLKEIKQAEAQLLGVQHNEDADLTSQLLQMVKSILKTDAIHEDQNFFEGGFNSLRAMALLSRIRTLGYNLSIDALFKKASVAELSQYLQQQEQQHYTPIPVSEIQLHYELLPGQKRFWMMHQFHPNASANIASLNLIPTAINVDHFIQAIKTVVGRHDSLRSVFELKGEEAYQRFIPFNEFSFEVALEDLSKHDNAYDAAVNYAEEVAATPFNLAHGPLLKVALLQVDASTHYFVFVIHHIICDGWSIDVISKEIQSVYKALQQHETVALPSLPIQYKDYISWFNNESNSDSYAASKSYWNAHLSGNIPTLNLPFERPLGDHMALKGATIRHQFDAGVSTQLVQLCAQNQVTTFTGIMSVLSCLLARYTGQDQFILGTDTAGRIHQDLELQVGYYLNLLALKFEVQPGWSFTELLGSVHQELLNAYTHQSYPFEALVDDLGIKRVPGKMPLFDILVLFQNFDNALGFEGLIEDVNIRATTIDNNTSLNDLLLEFKEEENGLSLHVRYNTAMYTAHQMQGFISHFEQLLSAVVADHNAAVESYEILDASAQSELLAWSEGETRIDPETSVVSLFELQAAQHPTETALVYNEEPLSYSALNARANQLAHYLVAQHKIKPGTKVGIMTNRGFDMIVSMLAILKTGAIYVPIDVNYPSKRIDYLIADSGVALVLSSTNLDVATTQVNLSQLDVTSWNTQNLERAITSDDIAYLMYTSGTTGMPKGVAISHGSLLDYTITFSEYFALSSNDVVLQQSSLSFDTAVEEIYPILSQGGKLVLTSEGGKAIEELMVTLIAEEVTLLSTTPLVLQAFNELLDKAVVRQLSLHTIISGGDTLHSSHIDKIPESISVYNTYGPTEATVCVTYYKLASTTDVHTIGQPIANHQVYILDNNLHLQPKGVIGELYLGGSGIAQGYHNQPELTEARFITNPFGSGKLYRTGDLGYWDATGSIRFIGRSDNQLKIRGYRVELSEVSHAMSACEGVDQSYVIGHTNDGAQQLVGYYTGNATAKALRQALEVQLPAYMIPSYLIAVPHFITTTNGKIDTNQLPLPEMVIERKITPPRNETDKVLIGIWKEVLGKDEIGIDDHFFELGGHSLRGVQIVSRVQKVLSVSISLKDVFTHPELHALSDVIATLEKERYQAIPVAVAQSYYPLSYAQRRLWFLDQLGIGKTSFNLAWLSKIEQEAQPFNQDAFVQAIKTVVARHDSLRAVFELKGEEAYQRFIPADEFLFEVTVKNIDRQEQALSYAQEVAATPFNLSKGPLLKVALLQVDASTHYFVFVIHHIICDGWSIDVISKEIQSVYKALQANATVVLPSLPIQYKDYISWFNNESNSASYAASKLYWNTHLSGNIPTLNLPFERPLGDHMALKGATIRHQFNAAVSQQFQQLCAENQVTTFTGIMSVLSCLLARYTGQDQFILGTDTAGRIHQDLELQVGYYLNLLALKFEVQQDWSFTELLGKVDQELLNAYTHQSYPFEALVDDLGIKRVPGKMPLFDILVLFQNFDNALGFEGLIEDVNIRATTIDNNTSLNDLLLEFKEEENGLSLHIRYNTALYTEAQMQGFISHFEQLLSAVVADHNAAVESYEILDASAQSELLAWSEGETRIDPETSVVSLFELQAAQHPTETALVYNEEPLSYSALNARANQLAHYLVAQHKIKPGTKVGIMTNRGFDMIVSMLAILKTGAIYVPIDVNYPSKRIDYLIADSGVALVLSSTNLDVATTQVNLSQLDVTSWNTQNLERAITSDDIAYLMYTSGTTGMPKGVAISHGSLLDYTITFSEYFALSSNDVVLQQSSLSFDTAVEEIYPILSQGGKLVLTTEGGKAIEELMVTMIAQEVTLLSTTPLVLQAFNELLDKAVVRQLSLHTIISGGDALHSSHIDKIPESISVYNTYGPTEATVCVTYYKLASTTDVHTIGQPIANHQVYILDKNLQLQPQGVIGELYLGGSGIAQGYHNQPELTEARFITNPFGSGKLYRTGDLGYWDATGTIRFIGRSDNQLKIRGYRVELSEVSHAMSACEGVDHSYVVGHTNDGVQQLVGYYTGNATAKALRQALEVQLPAYMIPSYLIAVPHFITTTNGKIDTNQLPLPEMVIERKITPPRNETDKVLIGIWKEVLGKDEIGIDDHFFELGGHSLRGVQIVSRVQKVLSVSISLKDVFTHPELHALSDVIATLEKERYQAIPVAVAQSYYPLSYAQRRLWFLEALSETATAYNVTFGHWLEGQLHLTALKESFESLIRRHESLRTVFKVANGEPVQQIQSFEQGNFEVQLENYEDFLHTEEELVAYIFKQYNTVFNLEEGPLFKVHLFRLDEHKHFLFLNIHHIIADEWSVQLLVRELQYVYNNLVKGNSIKLQPLTIQYKDFSVWQTELKKNAVSIHKQYWLAQLKGEITPLALPTSYQRKAQQTFNGARVHLNLGNNSADVLQQIVDDQEASLFMGALSLVKLLLFRYTGQNDIIVGTPVAGRSHPDLEQQVGFYLNTLVLRDELVPTTDFIGLLSQVKASCLAGYAHQEYPFDLLIEELDVVRDLSRSPLFDVMVVMEDMDRYSRQVNFIDLEVGGEYVDEQTSKFDLTFYFSKRDGDLFVTIEYNTDLFHNDRITRMATHLEGLLKSVVAEPSLALTQYEYLPPAESDQILANFNATAQAYPEGGSFLKGFDKAVVENPNGIAIRFGKTTLTYKEVDTYANQLANYLTETHSIKQGSAVGLLLDRSEWMLVAMLSVLKCGAIYVPIDKSYPQSRINYILEDSGAALLVTDTTVTLEADHSIDQVDLGALQGLLSNYDSTYTSPEMSGEALAYMIYTSGSTGTPKGVQIRHASVQNLMHSMARKISATAQDALFAVTTYAFDMSVVELFLPLHVGGTVIIADAPSIKSPEAIIEALATYRPSIMQATPGFWQMLVDAGWQGDDHLRIITGGEALSPSLGAALIAKTEKLWNMYGPTETTVYSTWKLVNEVADIPYIGTPVDNMQAYILDDQLQPVPIGVVGTLYMSGKGIAVGYQNKPELTADRFIASPFEDGAVLYNTGDLCSWSPEGDIKYLGRIDHQLKIRGYRIEVEEIIAAILAFEGVQQSVVVGASLEGEKYLVGYYTADASVEVSVLRTHLFGCLPEYMIPTYLVPMDAFLLTPNGKIDKRALPDPTASLVRAYVAPTNDTEKVLVAIWEEVLGKEQIGIKDNFFELGGHSLKGIQIITRIQSELGVKIALKELFEQPTLADLATKITLIGWASAPTTSEDNSIKKDTIIL